MSQSRWTKSSLTQAPCVDASDIKAAISGTINYPDRGYISWLWLTAPPRRAFVGTLWLTSGVLGGPSMRVP